MDIQFVTFVRAVSQKWMQMIKGLHPKGPRFMGHLSQAENHAFHIANLLNRFSREKLARLRSLMEDADFRNAYTFETQ
jgi:hypothetical protein